MNRYTLALGVRVLMMLAVVELGESRLANAQTNDSCSAASSYCVLGSNTNGTNPTGFSATTQGGKAFFASDTGNGYGVYATGTGTGSIAVSGVATTARGYGVFADNSAASGQSWGDARTFYRARMRVLTKLPPSAATDTEFRAAYPDCARR